MSSRRERRQQRLAGKQGGEPAQPAQELRDHPSPERTRSSRSTDGLLTRIYRDHYKALLLIPIIILVLSVAQIGYQLATTGDFIHKGVSLKGGLTLTVPVADEQVTPDELQSLLRQAYPANDVLVRGISDLGQLRALEIEAATSTDDPAELQALERSIISTVAQRIPGAEMRYSGEVIGPSLGASFFSQVLRAMGIAFLLMAAVIFLSFGESTRAKVATVALTLLASYLIYNAETLWMAALVLIVVGILVWLYIRYSIPSTYVILAALSDIVMTVAVINLIGVKLSSAGVAAFLMLIGYSVDTDILLTTRVLKHKRGTVYERVISSAKTGMTMSIASMAAALVGYFVSQSSTIKEIMLIIFIGLIADVIMTWIQNVALLRMYVEKRGIE